MKSNAQLKFFKSCILALVTGFVFSCGKYAVNTDAANNLNLLNSLQIENNISAADADIFSDGENIVTRPDDIAKNPPTTGDRSAGNTQPSSQTDSDVCTIEKVEQKIQRVEGMLEYFNGLESQSIDSGVISPERQACVLTRLNFAMTVLQELHSRLQSTAATEDCKTMYNDLIAEEGLTAPARCR